MRGIVTSSFFYLLIFSEGRGRDMKIKLRPFLASCAVMVLLLIQFTPMVAYATINPWEGNPWEGNEWNKNSWDGVTWESEKWDKSEFSSDPNTSTDSSSPKDNNSKEVNETKKIDKDDKSSSDFKIYDGLKFAGTMINESFVFAKDMLKDEALKELTDVKRLQNAKLFGLDSLLLGAKTLSNGTFAQAPTDFAYDSRDVIKNIEPARVVLQESFKKISKTKLGQKYLTGKFFKDLPDERPKKLPGLVTKLNVVTASVGTVLSGADAIKEFDDGNKTEGWINVGSTLMNASVVGLATPIPIVQAIAPFAGVVGAGIYAGGMIVKHRKSLAAGAKKVMKLGGKAKKGISNGFKSVTKSLGSLFG
jgi:hypothetical protein